MSTGYPVRHQFVMKQPTSSGQNVDMTSGVHLNALDGGAINVSSGGVIAVSSGGNLRLTDFQLITASSAGTIRNSGVTAISMSSDKVTGKFTLAAPVKGVTKVIHINGSSSNVVEIYNASSDAYFYHGELTTRHGIAMPASGLNMGQRGYVISLYSSGTATWRINHLWGTSSELYSSTSIA